MRAILCAVMMLVASADICVWAEGHETMKIAQATSEPSGPAATPIPGSPTPAPAQTAADVTSSRSLATTRPCMTRKDRELAIKS
jgi:hypothetical protein